MNWWLLDAKKCKKRNPQEAKRHRTGRVARELPGQVATQALFWTFCPSQDVPPFSGVGLVQLRLLFCQPRPHTALQDDQVVHVDQPPLTVRSARVGMGGWGREGGLGAGRDGWRDRAARITRHALRKRGVLHLNNCDCCYTLWFSTTRLTNGRAGAKGAASCVQAGITADCGGKKWLQQGAENNITACHLWSYLKTQCLQSYKWTF